MFKMYKQNKIKIEFRLKDKIILKEVDLDNPHKIVMEDMIEAFETLFRDSIAIKELDKIWESTTDTERMVVEQLIESLDAQD